MKKDKVFYPTVLGMIAAGFALSFGLGRSENFAQAPLRPDGIPSVSRTVKSSPSVESAKAAIAARFSAAASLNSGLRNNLSWPFGGRNQTGWNIYAPLIAQTIGTTASPDAPAFAAALAGWQTKRSLEPTGVLDRETMAAFVKFWQSQRLGRSGSPGDERLYSAPIGEFFDPTRSPDLLKLERETYAAYKRMIRAAAIDLAGELKVTPGGELAPDEKFLRIVSAFRSPEYQASLRRREPGAGRAALAVNSPHSTGQALDIYVGGEPVTTKDPNRLIQIKTPAYKWLVKNAHRFGFYPYFYEPWHWEYVPARLAIANLPEKE